MINAPRFRGSQRAYINGNYFVALNGYSRKWETLRSGEKIFKPNFPDSLDVKLTNKCGVGCAFCHESSFPSGKSFDPGETKKILSELPHKVPIELAFGGGDLLYEGDEDKIIDLLSWASDYGFNVAGTINMKSIYGKQLNDKQVEIFNLLENLGVSIDSSKVLQDEEHLPDILNNFRGYMWKNLTFHIILGIFPPKDLDELLKGKYSWISDRLLILGYKSFGRGKNMNPITPELLQEYKAVLKSFISGGYGGTMITVGFDNLAIEQLSLENFIKGTIWENCYLGDEFTNSMYLDAVEQTYAPTSRSSERVSWKEMGLVEYFQKNHKEWI